MHDAEKSQRALCDFPFPSVSLCVSSVPSVVSPALWVSPALCKPLCSLCTKDTKGDGKGKGMVMGGARDAAP